jgi:hypothetical protein
MMLDCADSLMATISASSLAAGTAACRRPAVEQLAACPAALQQQVPAPWPSSGGGAQFGARCVCSLF